VRAPKSGTLLGVRVSEQCSVAKGCRLSSPQRCFQEDYGIRALRPPQLLSLPFPTSTSLSSHLVGQTATMASTFTPREREKSGLTFLSLFHACVGQVRDTFCLLLVRGRQFSQLTARSYSAKRQETGIRGRGSDSIERRKRSGGRGLSLRPRNVKGTSSEAHKATPPTLPSSYPLDSPLDKASDGADEARASP